MGGEQRLHKAMVQIQKVVTEEEFWESRRTQLANEEARAKGRNTSVLKATGQAAKQSKKTRKVCRGWRCACTSAVRDFATLPGETDSREDPSTVVWRC